MKNWLDLTESFPNLFNLDRLRADYDSIKSANWLAHYDPDHSPNYNIMPLVSVDGRISDRESHRGTDLDRMRRTPVVEKLPYFSDVLDMFKCRPGRVRIMRLVPGDNLPVHRDIRHEAANFSLGLVRLHIPIYTNEKVVFNVSGENIPMRPGRLYYANFSAPHFVRNDGDEDRVHLVLDMEVNDWLGSIFPQPNMVEKAEHFLERKLLPLQWAMLRAKGRAEVFAWHLYQDSLARKLKHRLFD